MVIYLSCVCLFRVGLCGVCFDGVSLVELDFMVIGVFSTSTILFTSVVFRLGSGLESSNDFCNENTLCGRSR